MSEYEEILRSMRRTPEEQAQWEAGLVAYMAKRDPILERLDSGEITREEALDLLTEIKGGGRIARASAERLLANISLWSKGVPED